MKVHHIGYIVKDIEKSTRAFNCLGFKIDKDVFYDEIRYASICFLKNDEYRIELVSPNKNSPLSSLLKKFPNMPYHICYICYDIESTVKMLETYKFLLIKEIDIAPAISCNARVAFLINSNLGIIELLENKL